MSVTFMGRQRFLLRKTVQVNRMLADATQIGRMATTRAFWTFVYRQRIRGFAIPSTPEFESPLSVNWFREQLKNSGSYVEFGAGGSTYLAAELGVPFITVESDPWFLAALKRRLQADGLLAQERQSFFYRDIGVTYEWGYPLVLWKSISKKQREKFRRYSDFPIHDLDTTPGPIFALVDGRFRAACALKALKALRHRSDWLLAVDDYVGRAWYEDVQRFAQIDRFVGRMAVFKPLRSNRLEDIEDTIRVLETDPR